MEFRKRSCRSIMAGGSEMMMMPNDVIVDILSRLEVRSVLRCKCVCKIWKMIIEQKFFIEKHQRRLNNWPHIVFRYDTKYVSNGTTYCFKYCCNGLVLELKAMTSEYRIRNPTTKQVLQVAEDKSVIFRRCKAILGFDSSTGNYKMISFCRNKGKNDMGVIMATIGSDDLSYQSLDITLLCDRREPVIVCHNDVCYALSFCFDELEKSDIIRFTMDGKSSMNIKLPRGFQTGLVPGGGYFLEQYGRFRMFIVDDDKLSIGFIFRQELHVWVLENYNKHMWSEKIIIPLDIINDFKNPYQIIVHTSPNMGQLRLTIGKHFLEYDVDSKKYTCLAEALPDNPSWYHLIPSIVSVKGMRSQGRRSQGRN